MKSQLFFSQIFWKNSLIKCKLCLSELFHWTELEGGRVWYWWARKEANEVLKNNPDSDISGSSFSILFPFPQKEISPRCHTTLLLPEVTGEVCIQEWSQHTGRHVHNVNDQCTEHRLCSYSQLEETCKYVSKYNGLGWMRLYWQRWRSAELSPALSNTDSLQ